MLNPASYFKSKISKKKKKVYENTILYRVKHNARVQSTHVYEFFNIAKMKENENPFRKKVHNFHFK